VLVGEDPASLVYVGKKAGACEGAGIYEETVRLPADVPEEEVLQGIDRLNEDERFHGVLVQLPLPVHISVAKITSRISSEKDVDVFHPVNVGRLVCGDPYLLPCTPHGILQLLLRSGYSFEGKHIVICGRSNIVGKPLAAMLTQRGMETNAVTMCDTMTRNLASITRQADILVVAVGSPKFITADMVKPGAIVVDVGTNRLDDPAAKNGHRLTGDTDFEAIKDKAEAITPVPGGVGPMTVAMLSYNVIKAARKCADAQQH
ncbi:MAG: bifunctional 5,10-methylene-tetrahydrofolate dehydrogenase/5,10-methylene-tetrahydrofolate cyclohydrolase, partial [Dehalococcoidia bacterium]|nr:bifunctional 5,10-methylene-tetrahydrofolate dehydrogenase/5,10-methylene-tetrahydrofolate cyclohydrolase [Dehalococcoidia bacterium]